MLMPTICGKGSTLFCLIICQLSVCLLMIFLYSVEGFEWNLSQIFIMWMGITKKFLWSELKDEWTYNSRGIHFNGVMSRLTGWVADLCWCLLIFSCRVQLVILCCFMLLILCICIFHCCVTCVAFGHLCSPLGSWVIRITQKLRVNFCDIIKGVGLSRRSSVYRFWDWSWYIYSYMFNCLRL